MPHKKVIIVGCGRLGSTLANDLSADGHHVTVIDTSESSFTKLSSAFSGFKVVGDATELQTLKDANVREVDYLFAATTEDNTNLMVAQVAKEIFDIPLVIARVYDPQQEVVYADFGIETVSPTRLSASAFHQLVS